MLTKVQVYSSQPSASVLAFDENGRAEIDLIQITDISGLDPVEATVNTSSLGDVDGAAYIGTEVPDRNIVLTLRPNPDYSNWTFDRLRRFIYSYFMPRASVKLVFYNDEVPDFPVEINGIVEHVGANPFSKDPEFLVSIVCPDPYFTSTKGETISGSISGGMNLVDVPNAGNIPIGVYLKVDYESASTPANLKVQVQNSLVVSDFNVENLNTNNVYFEMNSKAMQKFVREVDLGSGVISNRLSEIKEGSVWPVLQPGSNKLGVTIDSGSASWEMTYFERYGGI